MKTQESEQTSKKTFLMTKKCSEHYLSNFMGKKFDIQDVFAEIFIVEHCLSSL